jgi:hypothetical protein
MRRLSLLIALVPTLAAAQPAPKTKPQSAKCERPGARDIAGTTKPGFRKLGELPPAKPIYTVVRQIEGCPIPVSVRQH